MAEFGSKVTNMGKSNYQGYVQQSVVDKSKAMDTASKFDVGTRAVTAAGAAYEDYDRNKTLGGVADSINEIVSEQEARSIQGQKSLAEGIMADQDEIATQKKAVGYDGTYPTALNSELTNNTRGITNALAEKTDMLSKAQQQGIMSKAELEERLKKIAREAMAANPAYTAEIMAHVTQVADINNIYARVAQDKAIIDAQQEDKDFMRKKLITKAFELNIFPHDPDYLNSDGSQNMEALNMAIGEKMQDLQNFEELKRANQTNEEIDKNDATKLLDSGYSVMVTQAGLTTTTAQLQQVLNSDSKSKEIDMQKISDRNLQEIKNFYTLNNVPLTDPRVKDSIQAAETQLNRYVKLFTDRANGTTESKEFENRLKTLNNKATMEFNLKNPGLAQMIPYLEAIKGFSALSGSKQLEVALQTRIVEAFNPNLTAASINDPENTKKDKGFGAVAPGKQSAMSMRTMAVLKSIDEVPENKKALERVLLTRANYINLDDGTADPAMQTQEVQFLIKDLASADMREGIQYITDPEVLSNLSGVVEEYKAPLANGVRRFKEQYPEAELIINPSSGIMMVKNPKPQHRPFMQGDLKSINETFTAFKNLNGTSGSTSADEFYADILGVPEEKK